MVLKNFAYTCVCVYMRGGAGGGWCAYVFVCVCLYVSVRVCLCVRLLDPLLWS